MFTTSGDTTIIGTKELRENIRIHTEGLYDRKVIVTKKGNPTAVILDYQEFKEIELYIDTLEDIVLSKIANDRIQTAKTEDIISDTTVMQAYGMEDYV